MMATKKPTTVSAYINSAPAEARGMLKELRTLLKKVAPAAKESIKWGAPVFEEDRILFAIKANKTHINFMPTRTTLDHFREELNDFKTGKDTIKLPYGKPIPKALITRIARFRAKDVRENGATWM